MEKRGPPNQPCYQLTRGLSRLRQLKKMLLHDVLTNRKYEAPPGKCMLQPGLAGALHKTAVSDVDGPGHADWYS